MAIAGEQAREPRRVMVRTIIAVVLGAWLVWQVVTAGFGALAARPSGAGLLPIMGTPAHPEAASVLAQSLLASGKRAEAAQLARSVVLVDPTNDRALRVLGLAIEALGRRDQGAAIMRQAGQLGWRDTETQLWILRDAALHDDFTTLIDRTDALARRNRSGQITQPIFLAAMTEPHLRRALVESLGRQPMWRGAFFANVRQNLPASSIDSMETLFGDLRRGGQAIAPVEWLSYVDRLIDLGQFQRARSVWARAFAIPPSRLAAVPYDGDFALAAARPADAPLSQFEWVFNPDLIGAVTLSAGTRGLGLPATIAGGTTIVSQLLILPAGDHVVSAQIEGPANQASAGWRLTCLPSKTDVPRRLTRGAEDELTTVAFTVPTEQCGAQRLTLLARDQLDAQAVTIGTVGVR